MTQDFLEYPKLVERAMRGVVREALNMAQDNGLPGLHHFYITFRTTDPEVTIGDRLLAQFPEEMTIVLEHQFWDLSVDEDRFSVTLSFGGVSERLVIPYDAITAFVDPSVKFGLQFDANAADGLDAPAQEPETATDESPPPDEAKANVLPTDDPQVVALDQFRKK